VSACRDARGTFEVFGRGGGSVASGARAVLLFVRAAEEAHKFSSKAHGLRVVAVDRQR